MEEKAKKSGLPICAGVLTLVDIIAPQIQRWLMGAPLSLSSNIFLLGTLISIFLAVALFMGNRKLLPLAFGLRLIVSISGFISAIALNSIYVFGANLVVLGVNILVFVLTLPQMQKVMQKFWILPSAILSVYVIYGLFSENILAGLDNLNVWAYFFLFAWLSDPSQTVKTLLFPKANRDSDKPWRVLLSLYLTVGAIFGLVISIVFGLMSRIGYARPLSHFQLEQVSFLLSMPLLGAVSGAIACIFVTLSTGRKKAKSFNRELNKVKAQSGVPGMAEHAKAELAKEKAKDARNAVIKGAVIGGIIGGDAGAIVGATAAKAEQDAKQKADK